MKTVFKSIAVSKELHARMQSEQSTPATRKSVKEYIIGLAILCAVALTVYALGMMGVIHNF